MKGFRHDLKRRNKTEIGNKENESKNEEKHERIVRFKRGKRIRLELGFLEANKPS